MADLSPSQRTLLDRVYRERLVQTRPSMRPAAVSLVLQGLLELTENGLIITAEGERAYRVRFHPARFTVESIPERIERHKAERRARA